MSGSQSGLKRFVSDGAAFILQEVLFLPTWHKICFLFSFFKKWNKKRTVAAHLHLHAMWDVCVNSVIIKFTEIRGIQQTSKVTEAFGEHCNQPKNWQ